MIHVFIFLLDLLFSRIDCLALLCYDVLLPFDDVVALLHFSLLCIFRFVKLMLGSMKFSSQLAKVSILILDLEGFTLDNAAELFDSAFLLCSILLMSINLLVLSMHKRFRSITE